MDVGEVNAAAEAASGATISSVYLMRMSSRDIPWISP
jgi:hypothetical protein